jgi:hypothetical protein
VVDYSAGSITKPVADWQSFHFGSGSYSFDPGIPILISNTGPLPTRLAFFWMGIGMLVAGYDHEDIL